MVYIVGVKCLKLVIFKNFVCLFVFFRIWVECLVGLFIFINFYRSKISRVVRFFFFRFFVYGLGRFDICCFFFVVLELERGFGI